MATTTNFKITLPTVGGDANAWGTILNTMIQSYENIIEDISGKAAIGGAANVYTYTPTHTGATALFNGLRVLGKVGAGIGNTGASTFNYNAIGAQSIKKIIDGIVTDVVNDDISPGMYADLVYSVTGADWILLNPSTLLQTGTAAQMQFATVTDRFPGVAQFWNAHQEVTLTDAATIAWDMSTGINFKCTLAGTRFLGYPTNITAGKRGYIRFLASGASRSCNFSANYRGYSLANSGLGGLAPVDISGSNPDFTLSAGSQIIVDYIAYGTGVEAVVLLPGQSHIA